MNLNHIDLEFQRLGIIDHFIDHEFEPKSKITKGKRNIYFEDLKEDFVKEVNTYGFSPFVLKMFEMQRKDPNIMKYMNKNFNHGLTNYVKTQNGNINGLILRFNQNKKKFYWNKRMRFLSSKKFSKNRNVTEEINQNNKLLGHDEEFLGKAYKIIDSTKVSNFDYENNIQKIKKQQNKKGEKIEKKILLNDEKPFLEKACKIFSKNTELNLDEEVSEKNKKSYKKRDLENSSFDENGTKGEIQEPIKNILPNITEVNISKDGALNLNYDKNFKEINIENKEKKLVGLNKNNEYLSSADSNKIKETLHLNEFNQLVSDSKLINSTTKNEISKVRENSKRITRKRFNNLSLKCSDNNSHKFLLIEKAIPIKKNQNCKTYYH